MLQDFTELHKSIQEPVVLVINQIMAIAQRKKDGFALGVMNDEAAAAAYTSRLFCLSCATRSC